MQVKPTETFGIARFLQLEKTVTALNTSAEKLIHISCDHGERLRELYEKLYHSASKIELSSALGHTKVTLQKFQNQFDEQNVVNQELERNKLLSIVNGKLNEYVKKSRADAEQEKLYHEFNFLKEFVSQTDTKIIKLLDRMEISSQETESREMELREKIKLLEDRSSELEAKLHLVESERYRHNSHSSDNGHGRHHKPRNPLLAKVTSNLSSSGANSDPLLITQQGSSGSRDEHEQRQSRMGHRRSSKSIARGGDHSSKASLHGHSQHTSKASLHGHSKHHHSSKASLHGHSQHTSSKAGLHNHSKHHHSSKASLHGHSQHTSSKAGLHNHSKHHHSSKASLHGHSQHTSSKAGLHNHSKHALNSSKANLRETLPHSGEQKESRPVQQHNHLEVVLPPVGSAPNLEADDQPTESASLAESIAVARDLSLPVHGSFSLLPSILVIHEAEEGDETARAIPSVGALSNVCIPAAVENASSMPAPEAVCEAVTVQCETTSGVYQAVLAASCSGEEAVAPSASSAELNADEHAGPADGSAKTIASLASEQALEQAQTQGQEQDHASDEDKIESEEKIEQELSQPLEESASSPGESKSSGREVTSMSGSPIAQDPSLMGGNESENRSGILSEEMEFTMPIPGASNSSGSRSRSSSYASDSITDSFLSGSGSYDSFLALKEDLFEAQGAIIERLDSLEAVMTEHHAGNSAQQNNDLETALQAAVTTIRALEKDIKRQEHHLQTLSKLVEDGAVSNFFGFAEHRGNVPQIKSISELLSSVPSAEPIGGTDPRIPSAREGRFLISARDLMQLKVQLLEECKALTFPAINEYGARLQAVSPRIDSLEGSLRRQEQDQAALVLSHGGIQQELVLLRKIMRAHSLALAKKSPTHTSMPAVVQVGADASTVAEAPHAPATPSGSKRSLPRAPVTKVVLRPAATASKSAAVAPTAAEMSSLEARESEARISEFFSDTRSDRAVKVHSPLSAKPESRIRQTFERKRQMTRPGGDINAVATESYLEQYGSFPEDEDFIRQLSTRILSELPESKQV